MRFTYAIALILAFAFCSCSPVLHLPNTPNVPTVDTSKRTELKLGGSFSAIDLQFNHLIHKKHIVQFSSTLPMILYSEKPVLKIGLGYGKIISASLDERFTTSTQLGYSLLNNRTFGAFDFISDYHGGGEESNDILIHGNQYHISQLLSMGFKTEKYNLTNSAHLELGYSPKAGFTRTTYNGHFGTQRTSSFSIENLYYVLAGFNFQIAYSNWCLFTIGTKIPINTNFNEPEYKKLIFINREYIYLRAHLRLIR
ncbi:MAG: hypothetical protein KDC92_07710 [Bacteroidetes bacterium]|nr:hypothetical protein [Bacteroidota bacterium]